MTRILRLLMIAAVAWPLWQPAAAQEVTALGPNNTGVYAMSSVITEMTAIDDGMIIPKKGSRVSIKNKEKLVDVSHVKNSPKGNPILKAEGTLVTPPAGKHIEEWDAEINFYRYNGSSFANEDMGVVSVGVVIDGTDIYVCGLSYFMDKAWVKGTINGTTVTFPTGQYFGSEIVNGTEYPFYFIGRNSSNNEAAVRFTYDETNKTLTLNNGYRIYEGDAASLSSAGLYNYRTNNTVLRKHRTGEQGVGNGGSTNSYVPVWGNYYERTQHNQMIYPESSLKYLKGKKLTSMTFFTNGGVKFSGGSVKVSLGTTTTSVFSSSNAITNVSLTQVASIVPSATSTSEWTITFSTPFQYDGNNLLVDIVTTAGSDQATSFYGDSQSGYTAFYSRSGVLGGSNGRQQFLPKVRFTHETTMLQRNIVVKDSTFFKAQKYTWTDAEGTHESNLNEIATKPEQMIAMLREIYTNKAVPGNLKRGCESDGTIDAWDDVYYGGVGQIWGSGSVSDASSYYYHDGYGWNIPGDLKFGSIQKSDTEFGYFCYMDTTQYRPDDDGLTLLLVEMVDDFDNDSVTTTETDPQLMLRDYFAKSIKSIRVVNQAKRTGTGFDTGYLFKIDCDKMNKFFLLAKGQLRWVNNSYEVSATSSSSSSSSVWLGEEFCAPPGYIFYTFLGNDENTYTANTFSDKYGYDLFYHMFEQFSPVATEATHGRGDIYQDLINMESFGVQHDCASVSGLNHQFMMYGDDSDAADCQDVRDMMFFIPDYRMMRGYGRDNERNIAERYLYYNSERQPMMGLYVIRQNEITPTTAADDYYMLNLNWVTNLDDFLPGEEQEFELLQVVINDSTGIEEYKPVYYMNAQGQYTDSVGNVVTTPVPIVLHLGSGAEKNYPSVYVKRQSSSQQVTYAIRGRDTGHFLSLQISNRQSYIIPGTDPTELVSLIELAHYSRYNPQNEENCYSNRFKLSNNAGGVRRADITSAQNNETVFTFTRKTSSTDENPVTIATATVTNKTTGGGTITIVMQNQDEETEFPRAKSGSGYAGYHANPGDGTTWTKNFTYKSVNGTDYVDFGDFVLCDNFIAEVSENAHPNQYIYEVHFNIARGQEGPSGQLGAHDFDEAHGSAFRVPIYKTASKVNNYYTSQQVDGDTKHTIVVDDLTFSERVQYSSKTEILRYDVYRWPAGETRFIVNTVGANDAEQDLAPDGIAGNQGESYTVTMNDVDGNYYYNGGTVAVSSGTAWADFVDYYPAKVAESSAEGKAYVYAPVVETFTVGKNVVGQARTDYNTYGGPQQVTAVGALELVQRTGVAPMSKYYWTETVDSEEKKFAYYDIQLNVPTKEIPSGYSIYKVRVWRQVLDEYGNPAPGLLREEYADQSDDIAARMGVNGEFMFEINYDDDEMNAFINNAPLGSTEKEVTVNGADNNEQTIEYTIGTFGAQKLRTEGDNEQGVIDELNLNFKVRMYFTRTANLSGSKDEADGKFYIVEQEIPVQIKSGGTITGVESLVTTNEVVGMKYYNPAGIESDTPFKGVNIVVTRYSDGSTTTTKILK